MPRLPWLLLAVAACGPPKGTADAWSQELPVEGEAGGDTSDTSTDTSAPDTAQDTGDTAQDTAEPADTGATPPPPACRGWTRESTEVDASAILADVGGEWLAAGDLDGDGHADLVVGASTTMVFAGPIARGALTDADAVALVSGSGVGGCGSGIAAVDLDGDGRDDLAVGCPSTSRISWSYVHYGPLSGTRGATDAELTILGYGYYDAFRRRDRRRRGRGRGRLPRPRLLGRRLERRVPERQPVLRRVSLDRPAVPTFPREGGPWS